MFKQTIVFCISLSSVFFLGCSKNQKGFDFVQSQDILYSKLYSYVGLEYAVSFVATLKNDQYSLQDLSQSKVKSFLTTKAKENVRYLFGPLTNREIGGMKLNYVIEMDFQNATQSGQSILIPYKYSGTWIILNEAIEKLKYASLPLPLNSENLITKQWKSCTDSSPEHQTQDFFWYFWDPNRNGCDHQLNIEYQMIAIKLGVKTVNQKETYPEYKNIINSNSEKNNLTATFAFGYYEDSNDANPDKDTDYGMTQFRKFQTYMDQQAQSLKLTKTPITQSEYLNSNYPNKLIGYKYSGVKSGVKVEIKIVTAANIDQMELFAKSYAHDHDGFFGWFGHSRVGSGFDADNFSQIIKANPEFYSLSSNYQLVYWAGCNSYSYYTLPFFAQKSNLNKAGDPNGTKNLDIIANALPSQFSFNANNAKVAFDAIINWEKPTSYQSIISSIEINGQKTGATVIVNVLGDEDNVKP